MNKRKNFGAPSVQRATGSGLKVAPVAGDYDFVLSIVCEYFCQGRSPTEIAKVMGELHGRPMGRETPYRLLGEAARRGLLSFRPPEELWLQGRLLKRFAQALPESEAPLPIRVAHSRLAESAASVAAEVVLGLIRAKARARAPGKRIVHVGFGGGWMAALIARNLGRFLENPVDDRPERIVFHSMMAGVNPEKPSLSPTAFLAQLVPPVGYRMAAEVDTDPVRLEPGAIRRGDMVMDFPAPPFAKLQEVDGLRAMPSIKHAVDERSGLDVVVTSAGSLADPHSSLHAMVSSCLEEGGVVQQTAAKELLRRLGCVGDLLWLPLTSEGGLARQYLSPADRDVLQYWPMTLIELAELEGFIAGGTKVVLALAPCQICMQDKSDIMLEILRQNFSEDTKRHRFVTHLVVDSTTARRVLDKVESKADAHP